MNPEEYAKLERLDRTHWFYRGKRAVVRHWIERYRPLGPGDTLVDAGTGTGTWLVEAGERTGCRIVGLDDHEESIAIARPRVEALGGRVLQTALDRVDLPAGDASVITMLDVLEHLDDDAGAVREMTRLLRPGGLLVVTVPALMQLWSDWDVVLHHRRRYHRAGLVDLFRPFPLELLHCAYFNSLMLPPIWLVRTVRKAFPPKPGGPRAEDQIPPGPLNALLYQLMVGPARWGWFKPPAGVSLLAVLRRAPDPAPAPAS